MKRLLLCIAIAGTFQVSAQKKVRESAIDNFNKQQWEEAAQDYSKYLKKNKGDSLDWYNLAFSEVKLEQFEKAAGHYKEALARNYPAFQIYMGLSNCYAKTNDEASLVAALNEGSKKGFSAYTYLKNHPSFAQFQKSADFQSALEKIKLNAYPCLSSTDYRHFDFWLGEWDVYAGGNKVGENSITMAKGGCAVHESYTTARNYAGQSINYFDPIDKKWHQHWVGSGGDTYNYLETKRGPGLLQFESPFMGQQGKISLSRLTFTLNDDGTVRQLFESSTDGGKTWTPAFDGLYKKKK